MNVAIACGGSGGHLFPGIAVAELLRPRGHRLLLLVSGKDIDRHAINAIPGVEVRSLPAIGMPSWKSPVKFLQFGLRLLQAIRECRGVLGAFKPDVVLGMGGFASVPAGIAAWRAQVPLVIHDSNAVPGRATRFLARFARGIAVSVDEAARFFPGRRVVNTGTPVRSTLRKVPPADARWQLGLDQQRRTILIIGGSQGARGLNNLVLDALP
ncbi:MAG: UDP-N-acetylglucosamine--N-acetylmuramyl-(pentapeptide) pyrophosphoryl-undecaprenol N-acetylglucosamine transferase, partial [Verrucomicrobia bacterium]|nr:UDP-N-acetylglucosamine--N-acetylmuramyl-(pentapeptide) pyrophosphoryl-undecaprenol N-acetylglucosamine transferase [Verrucomicrobiota bacterium]